MSHCEIEESEEDRDGIDRSSFLFGTIVFQGERYSRVIAKYIEVEVSREYE